MDTVAIPLASRPRILAIAQPVHGESPIDRWFLPHAWCLHTYDYHAELRVDGRDYEIVPGSVSLLAPGTRQEYRYRTKVARHIYCHFTVETGETSRPAPVLVHLGTETADFRRAFALAAQRWPLDHLRAEVSVWELLWRLVEIVEREDQSGAPAVLRRVVARIEAELDRNLAVADLAADHGISHNHLTRLFQAHLGSSAIGYLRRRRGERALELLRHSDLPIAEIARRVGIPDPQHFNKTIRALYGHSPRRLRQDASSG